MMKNNYVSLNGLNMYYGDHGFGKPLVLLQWCVIAIEIILERLSHYLQKIGRLLQLNIRLTVILWI